jgi:hypothetical protein
MEVEDAIATVSSWLSVVDVATAEGRVIEFQEESAAKARSVSLATAPECTLARSCLHESAHGVVAHRFGLRVDQVCVRDDGSGFVAYGSDGTCVEDVVGVVAFDLAGAVSELMYGVDEGRRFHLAVSHDILKARLGIERCRALGMQLTGEAFAQLSCCAVVSNWGLILRVSAALRALGDLDGPTIVALCGRVQ